MADSGTYDQATILRRQKIAEQMLSDATKFKPVRNWAEGLDQLGGAALGAFAVNKADKEAKASREADRAAIMGLLGGGNAPGSPAPAAPMSMPSPAPAPDAGGAIAGIESGGKYDALGPVTKTGDRAYGKYQVMGANIPEWTRAHTGREMTPQEFVASPEAQDAVFKGQFGNYEKKYGPEGAARAWFAGEQGMNDLSRTDQLGTSVADYSKKFTSAMPFNGEPSPSGPVPTPAPANAPIGAAAVAQAMTPQGPPGQPPAPTTAPLAPQNAPQGIPEQQRKAIAAMMMATPGSPAQQLGLTLAGQALKPKDYGFQTLPDGTILRTDPHQGTVQPIYQAPSKPTFVPNIGPNRYGVAQPGFVDTIKGTATLPNLTGAAAPGVG